MTKFRKLGRPTGHRMSMLRTMVSQLVKHERIETIVAKAKEVRRLAGNYGPTWQGGIDQVDTPDCFGPYTTGRCSTNGLYQRTTSVHQIFGLALNEELGLEPSEKVMQTGLLTEKMSLGRQSHQLLNHHREHPLIPRLDLVSLGSLHLLKEEKSESEL